MLHWIAIGGSFALLVALGMILEITLRSHWPQIAAALRGDLSPR